MQPPYNPQSPNPNNQPQQPTNYPQWPNQHQESGYAPHGQPANPYQANHQQWNNSQQPPLNSYSYQQQWMDQERFRAAMTRSYLTPAIITLILYFVFWLPGLIVNIVYFVSAQETKRQSGGRAPEGYGCLLAMLLVWTIIPIAFIGLFFMASLVTAVAGTP